ncbi:hypothetical protein GNI_150880 [Gregarina niphandrodes]|uniref:Uncharacterized protein n=1 Tax=Gregarina niphandrodes TaxID=110365 RepID=A0A023AZL4_GRENI|nr:hypothetical protein GNI_150880 [Gregarina niphandrodes]EZG44183.1 hypothetical protein GNI_150880 [Gregarina niphandrodes]|eukprot:XP_011132769.1 hypothetical protein GNI_150880 [Gregarina niphandrodes]
MMAPVAHTATPIVAQHGENDVPGNEIPNSALYSVYYYRHTARHNDRHLFCYGSLTRPSPRVGNITPGATAEYFYGRNQCGTAEQRNGPADGRYGPADGRYGPADGRYGPAEGRYGTGERRLYPIASSCNFTPQQRLLQGSRKAAEPLQAARAGTPRAGTPRGGASPRGRSPRGGLPRGGSMLPIHMFGSPRSEPLGGDLAAESSFSTEPYSELIGDYSRRRRKPSTLCYGFLQGDQPTWAAPLDRSTCDRTPGGLQQSGTQHGPVQQVGVQQGSIQLGAVLQQGLLRCGVHPSWAAFPQEPAATSPRQRAGGRTRKRSREGGLEEPCSRQGSLPRRSTLAPGGMERGEATLSSDDLRTHDVWFAMEEDGPKKKSVALRTLRTNSRTVVGLSTAATSIESCDTDSSAIELSELVTQSSPVSEAHGVAPVSPVAVGREQCSRRTTCPETMSRCTLPLVREVLSEGPATSERRALTTEHANSSRQDQHQSPPHSTRCTSRINSPRLDKQPGGLPGLNQSLTQNFNRSSNKLCLSPPNAFRYAGPSPGCPSLSRASTGLGYPVLGYTSTRGPDCPWAPSLATPISSNEVERRVAQRRLHAQDVSEQEIAASDATTGSRSRRLLSSRRAFSSAGTYFSPSRGPPSMKASQLGSYCTSEVIAGPHRENPGDITTATSTSGSSVALAQIPAQTQAKSTVEQSSPPRESAH